MLFWNGPLNSMKSIEDPWSQNFVFMGTYYLRTASRLLFRENICSFEPLFAQMVAIKARESNYNIIGYV